MFPFAASLIAQIDADTTKLWLHIGLAALVIGTVFIVLWRMSRIILTLIALGVVGYVAYTWCYERTEPAFLSPFVDRIVPHLPNLGNRLPQPQPDTLPVRDKLPPPDEPFQPISLNVTLQAPPPPPAQQPQQLQQQQPPPPRQPAAQPPKPAQPKPAPAQQPAAKPAPKPAAP